MDPNLFDPAEFTRVLLAVLAAVALLVLLFCINDPFEGAAK